MVDTRNTPPLFDGLRTVQGLLLDAYERGMRRGVEIASETADSQECVGWVLDETASEAQVMREMQELRS